MNPVSEWVWWPARTHDALVGLEPYTQTQQVAEHRERSHRSI
jgi:hypothetical protein